MPLSISNSDCRMKAGRWGSTWLMASLVALVLLGFWELCWRLQGFDPSLTDDWNIWAIQRRAASQKGRQPLALVGSSRIQLGLQPDVFAKVTGIRPVNLYIDGSSPLSVLEHLSQDPRFKGHVLCSLIPMFLAQPSLNGRAQKWIRRYQEQKWSSRMETRLSMLLQRGAAFRNSGLAPSRIWSDFQQSKWPQMPYAPMRPDRFRPADFARADIAAIRAARIRRERENQAVADPLPLDLFMQRVAHIDRMVKQIQARGGQVAFVRFPSGEAIRKIEGQTWPRSTYWDNFAERISVPAIHFEDYPSLSAFETPDGSHLDARNAARFTRSLIRVLEDKGFRPWNSHSH